MPIRAQLSARVLAAVSLAGIWLGPPPARAEDTKASVAITAGSFDGIISPLGIHLGIFKKYGIDLSTLGVRSGPELVSAVMSGSTDFAVAAPLIAVPAILKGAPITTLLTNYELDYSLVAPKDSKIDVSKPYPAIIQELKGKRIGVTARGGITELFARKMMTDAGLNLNTDATVIAAGVGVSAVGALQNDQVDVMVIFPPTEFILGEGNYKVVVSNETARNKVLGRDFILGVMVANTKMVETKPDVVLNFCKAFKETVDYMHDSRNEKEVVAFLEKSMNLATDKATTMFRMYKDNFSVRMTPERWAVVQSLNSETPAFEKQVYKPCADLSVR